MAIAQGHVGKRRLWHKERPERFVQLGPHFRALLILPGESKDQDEFPSSPLGPR